MLGKKETNKELRKSWDKEGRGERKEETDKRIWG